MYFVLFIASYYVCTFLALDFICIINENSYSTVNVDSMTRCFNGACEVVTVLVCSMAKALHGSLTDIHF